MSASEAVTAFPTARTGERPAIGSEQLAKGLLLVRASTLNVIRLQLAMERRDRPVALQTVDELMLLDRQIGEFMADLALAGDGAAGPFALEDQRRRLMIEKFALTAGVSGPGLNEEPVRSVAAARASGPAAHSEEIAADAPQVEPAPEDEPRRMSARLVVALAFLALFAAAAAFLFLTETGRALLAAPAAVEGAVQ